MAVIIKIYAVDALNTTSVYPEFLKASTFHKHHSSFPTTFYSLPS